MKKALLLHGWGWDSENNWFPWLKTQLIDKWYYVEVPNLSNTEKPVLAEQLSDIADIVQWFTKDDLIIWHSLGCQLALQAINTHNLQNIWVIFIWPSYPWVTAEIWVEIVWDSYETLAAYNDAPVKFTQAENTYVVFLSQDDPYIKLEHAEHYYCMLENVEFVEFEDKGHFNNSAKVFELPDILEYI